VRGNYKRNSIEIILKKDGQKLVSIDVNTF
jgi:hypothetical protein